MRILFCSEMFRPQIGGVEVLSWSFTRTLRERGHEILVVTKQHPGLTESSDYDGVRVQRAPLSEGMASGDVDQLMAARLNLKALVRDFNPELVHVYYPGPTLMLLPWVLRPAANGPTPPPPLLVTLHDTRPDPFMEVDAVAGAAVRAGTWVTAVSSSVLSGNCRQVPEIASRASVILNAMEMPRLAPEPLRFGSPRLLCVGRLVHQKGFDVALRALPGVLARVSDARLVISGDGQERRNLEELSSELGVDGSVEFVGWTAPQDVPSLMNTATLVLAPSRTEPFGLVALQAAQMGRPVVGSNSGGLIEIIVHEQTGLLFQEEDTSALADGIVSLLTQPLRARQMGQAARRRAENVFDWERHISTYERLYRRLLNGRPGDPRRSHP